MAVEEDTTVAGEEGGVADKEQRVAVASNYRYSIYITNSQMILYCRYALYLQKNYTSKITDIVN